VAFVGAAAKEVDGTAAAHHAHGELPGIGLANGFNGDVDTRP